jgi:hypothetical protein
MVEEKGDGVENRTKGNCKRKQRNEKLELSQERERERESNNKS